MSVSRAEPGSVARRHARNLALTLGIGALALVVHSPMVAGSYGVCPSQLLGFACPGCGGLRATASLLHGDVSAAWAYNPLAVLLAPALVALLVRWLVDARANRAPWAPSLRVVVIGAVVLLGYGIARNVPALTPLLGPLAVP